MNDSYEDKSDFDINKAVAEALGIYYAKGEAPCVFTDTGSIKEVDYCNNPSDMDPIINEYKISIVWSGMSWVAMAPLTFGLFSYETKDEDGRLRAAAIVFLKMQEIEK